MEWSKEQVRLELGRWEVLMAEGYLGQGRYWVA
jgi:hypothetical protein